MSGSDRMVPAQEPPEAPHHHTIHAVVKWFLHQVHAAGKPNSDPELGKTDPCQVEPTSPNLEVRANQRACCQKLLLAFLVLLALTFMVLLLLWNYQCIIIHRFCQEHTEDRLPVPMFSQQHEEGERN